MKMGHKRIILDYHFSSFLPQTLTHVDPEDYVRKMKTAGIEAFLIYAKDHWGNVYHNSKISPNHPNAPKDMLRKLITLCHQHAITPYVYFTLMWDEHSARTHPEWRMKDGAGQLISGKDAGWNFLCVNTGYRQHLLAQIEEIAATHEFPALFLDILAYNASELACHCESCQALWFERYGEDLPATLDLKDRARYTDFRDSFYATLYQQVRDVLARHGKSDCMVTHNCNGTAPELPSYIGKETEPFGQDYVIPQIICKETRNRAAGRDAEIYFGRFNRFWDFTVKSTALLRWEVINVFAHSLAATMIDQPLLDGALDPSAYQAIQFAYDHGARLLEFTSDTKPYAEIAVYYDHKNYEITGGQGHEDFIGACKILMESHLPYDLVTDFDDPAKKLPYNILIVPHTPLMSSAHALQIKQYVEQGGTVICDYIAGQYDQHAHAQPYRHFLMDIQRDWPMDVNFIRPSIHPRDAYVRVSSMVHFTEHPEDEVLATVQPGALKSNNWVWVSHNTPPGDMTDSPAAVVRRIGKGQIVYFNSPVFAEYLRTNLLALRQFILNAIHHVYKPVLTLNAPSIVDAIFQQKKGQPVITLNCCTLDRGANSSSMNYGTKPPLYMNINESYPIGGIEIISRRKITQAILLSGQSCDIVPREDNWHVILPPVNGYESIQLQWASK